MTSDRLVPAGFDPPTTLVTDQFRLEPLGPRAELDVPLADAVARWLATDWPWKRVDRSGR